MYHRVSCGLFGDQFIFIIMYIASSNEHYVLNKDRKQYKAQLIYTPCYQGNLFLEKSYELGEISAL